MRTVLLILFALSASASDLQIYAIDTEGGKSTLYVSPSGESMLVDAGYDGNNNRDADRIMAAIAAAGLNHIDYFVLTHYHGDHAGGVKQLAAKIRIDRFYDHGNSVEAGLDNTWKTVAKSHTVLHPGDTIPIKGLNVKVIASGGKPTQGERCDGAPGRDESENSQSIAMTIAYGKFRIAEFGDLSPDREFDLACPVNRIGHVDLYMTTHHGTGTSVPAQILDALTPRAAVMDNGTTKGGSVKALGNLHDRQTKIDLWQLHYSNAGGEKLNAPEPFIANLSEACQGKGIHIAAFADGSFTVQNQRNSFRKTYPALN